MNRYVLGFSFYPDGVMLIYKLEGHRKGLWNGIGGKIEDGELPIEAMVREFREETSIGTQFRDWKVFATVGSGVGVLPWDMVVFERWSPVDDGERTSSYYVNGEGIVSIVETDAAPMDSTCRWLLDLCVDKRLHRLEVDIHG